MDPLKIDENAGVGDPEVGKWLKEIHRHFACEKDYREETPKIVKIYEAEDKSKYVFNILYSNTETLAPSLYSVAPRPRVVRRYKDEDPLGKHGCRVVQRILEFLMDAGQGEYPEFDEIMRTAVVEGLVAGRGVSRFKYDAAVQEKAPERVEIGGEITDEEAAEEIVEYEIVCGEEIPWDRFIYGSAKKWCQVPWAGVIHYMTRDELVENFGEEIGNKVKLTKNYDKEGDVESSDKSDYMHADAKPELACVYEVWDKRKREIVYFSDGYPDGFLKDKIPDPFKLSSFYPWPKPLQFSKKITDLIPKPLYCFYEEQAKELNRVSRRINVIVEALKVRGFYDSTLEGIEAVMTADDNTLVPTANVTALQDGKTLENSIWLMPIEKLIGVLQQLYIQRAEIKQVIYEITGISDIMRSTSAASESATAQKIKNEWGNLRLRRWQREVQRYARDGLRIEAEIAVTKLSIETIKAMTGLPYLFQEEKMQLQQQADLFLQQVPPEQQQQMMQEPQIQQMQQLLELPSWEEIMEMLQNDALRSYKIDIETNSTLDADVSEDKQNMDDFLNAMSQFFLAVTPLVEKGTLPFEAAQAMLMHITRKFNFGPEVEDQLSQMQPPPSNMMDAEEVQKQQEEIDKAKQDLQKQQMAFQEQQMQAEHDLKMQEMELQMLKKEIAMEMKMAQQQLQMQNQQMSQNLQMQQQKVGMAIEGQMHKAQLQEQQNQQNAQTRASNDSIRQQQMAQKQKEADAKQPPKGKK